MSDLPTLLKTLPQGYPFRMVDGVAGRQTGAWLQSRRVIGADSCHLCGSHRTLPLYALLESLGQTAELFIRGESDASAVLVLAAVRELAIARFPEVGSVLDIRAELRQKAGSFWETFIEAAVGGDRLASGVFVHAQRAKGPSHG